MKASIFLVGASAILACAKPIHRRALETEWVTDYVTVTVIAGEQPTQSSNVAVFEEQQQSTTTVVAKPIKNNIANPPPKPVFSTVVVQAQPTTSQPAAQVTTVVIKPQVAATTTAAAEKPKATAADTSSSSSSSSSSDNLSLSGAYSDVMTNYHNIHRSNHSVSDVTWDDGLAASALVLANGCVFEHNVDINGGGYGQNIAAWASSDIGEGEENKYGAVSVTDQWYNSEMENWSYYGQANPPSGLDLDLFGHFTQVVWKGTSQIGCATAYCPSGKMYSGMNAYFTVCNYKGPGNYGGEYGDNVLPPLGKKMVVV